MQMLPEHARRLLHRHVVAREGNHLAATHHMERVQRGVFQGRFVARQHSGTLWGFGDQPPKTIKKAPSVAVPESIIPSADAVGPKARGVSFQMSSSHAVRLPESFRGGCSFGAGA